MKKKSLGVLLWVVVFQAVGYGLGWLTQGDIDTWYVTLHHSRLTPPPIVFPLVWSALYVMLAIAGWSLWQHRAVFRARLALGFFGVQMLLNWAWTPIFFGLHWIGFGFFCIVLMVILTLICIAVTQKMLKLSALLLMPYLVWLIFAAYLNGMIWVLN